jgi:hypothetical protein
MTEFRGPRRRWSGRSNRLKTNNKRGAQKQPKNTHLSLSGVLRNGRSHFEPSPWPSTPCEKMASFLIFSPASFAGETREGAQAVTYQQPASQPRFALGLISSVPYLTPGPKLQVSPAHITSKSGTKKLHNSDFQNLPPLIAFPFLTAKRG